MTLENRVVVSPMCQYSAEDGLPNDWHLVHYGSRAIGGAGLMFTEMTDVSEDARISLGCAGMYNDAHEAAWKRIVDFVHVQSKAKFCLQLGHAGRKGATKLMWEGIDEPLEEGGWPIISPSPLPYYPHSAVPRAMIRADMEQVITDFVAAAARASAPVSTWSSCMPRTVISWRASSRRSPIRARPVWRLAREPLALPARSVPRHARGLAPREADVGPHLGDRLGGRRTDRRRCGRGCARYSPRPAATSSTSRPARPLPMRKPVFGRMFQTPFSDQIRNEAGLATMCVGAITTADQVNTIVAAGRADLVALARPHLVDPYFTMKAAAWYGAPDIHCPPQYLAGKEQIFRNSARDREDLRELRLKAKPKGHGDIWEEAAE